MSLRARVGLRLLPLLALALCSLPAAGQEWVVDASAGGSQYTPLAGVSTRSAMVGLQYQDLPWLYLAAGTPLDAEGLPWGAGGLGTRLEARRAGIEFGAELGAGAFGYRDPSLDAWGTGGTLDLLPFVALARGSARLELQTGLVHFQSRFDGQTVIRQTLHQSTALLSLRPEPRVRFTGEARLARADEGDYPFAGAGVELTLGRGELWGDFGRWMSDDFTTADWSVGGSAQLTGRTRLRAWYAQESEDPLYWNLPRRRWNVGLSHTLGRGVAASPRVPVTPPLADGRIMIRIPLAEAQAPPSVAGDFNQWSPTPMTRSPEGWFILLSIPPGVYHYAFRRGDGEWFVPDSVPNRVSDGFGGHSAVLVVPASGKG